MGCAESKAGSETRETQQAKVLDANEAKIIGLESAIRGKELEIQAAINRGNQQKDAVIRRLQEDQSYLKREIKNLENDIHQQKSLTESLKEENAHLEEQLNSIEDLEGRNGHGQQADEIGDFKKTLYVYKMKVEKEVLLSLPKKHSNLIDLEGKKDSIMVAKENGIILNYLRIHDNKALQDFVVAHKEMIRRETKPGVDGHHRTPRKEKKPTNVNTTTQPSPGDTIEIRYVNHELHDYFTGTVHKEIYKIITLFSSSAWDNKFLTSCPEFVDLMILSKSLRRGQVPSEIPVVDIHTFDTRLWIHVEAKPHNDFMLFEFKNPILQQIYSKDVKTVLMKIIDKLQTLAWKLEGCDWETRPQNDAKMVRYRNVDFDK